MSRTTRHSEHGFTLLELVVVILIVGLVSVTALPALNQVQAARQAGARSEIVSQLRSARAHALALGDPSGLSIDLGAQSFQLVTVPPGAGAQAMLDPLGAEEPVRRIEELYPGASFASVTLLDGSSGSGVIWFSNDGTPEVRDESGAYVGVASADAVIVLEGADAITVDRLTGRIE